MIRTALVSFVSLASATALTGCLQKTNQTATKSTAPAPAAAPADDTAAVGGNENLEECVASVQDKEYAHASRLWVGKAKGQCILNENHRPVRRLTEEEAASKGLKHDDKEFITIANVTHDNRFWFAEIPVKAIKDVYFQLEHFPSLPPQQSEDIVGKLPGFARNKAANGIQFLNDYLAGHTQLRLQFTKPIKLKAQVGSEEATINDLVFSVEAVGQKGYAFDLVAGLQKNFVAMHRVTSLTQKYYDMVIAEEFGAPKNHVVEQGVMSFSPDAAKNQKVKERLIKVYIEKSELNWQQIEMQEDEALYNTVTRNCTTEVIRAMDQALQTSNTLNAGELLRYKAAKAATKAVYFFPMVVHEALQQRGLLARSEKVYEAPSLCDDQAMAEFKAKANISTCATIKTTRPSWLK